MNESWESVDARIAEAYRAGEEPDQKDIEARREYEREWELSHPVAAGWYPANNEGAR